MTRADDISSLSSAVLKAILNSSLEGSATAASSVHTIEAVVVERQSKENPLTTEKGILLDGKFVKIVLPDEIRNGDLIKVRVAQSAIGVQLTFVDKLDEVSRSPSEIAKQLLQLITNLKLSSERLNLIRESLQPAQSIVDAKEVYTQHSGLPKTSTIDKSLSSNLHFFSASASQVSNEPKQVSTVKIIESAINNLDTKSLLQAIADAKEAHSKTDSRAYTPQQKIILQEIESNLRQLIKKIEVPLNSAQAVKEHSIKFYAASQSPQHLPADNSKVDTVVKFKDYSRYEAAVNKLSEQRYENSNGGPVARLLTFFAAVGERGSELLLDGEKKLFKIFNDQITVLKSIEQQVKKLLLPQSGDTPLSNLIRVLDQIDVNIESGDNQVQIEFKKFISHFSSALKAIYESKTEPLILLEFLEENLSLIYSKFGLLPLQMRAELGRASLDEMKLSSPQINALRAIEVQIKTILAMPANEIFEQSDLLNFQGLPKLAIKSKELSSLLEMLDNFKHVNYRDGNSAIGEEVRSALHRLDKRIKDIVSGNSNISQAAKELKEALQTALQEGIPADLLQPQPQRVPSGATFKLHENFAKRDLLSSANQHEKPHNHLSDVQHEQLKAVANLLQDLIASNRNIFTIEDSAFNQLPALIAKHPAYKSLIELLKSLDFSISNPDTQQQQDLLDLSGKLLHILEKDLFRPQSVFKENLQKAFEELRIRLYGHQDADRTAVLNSLDFSNLKALEGIVAGQEMLQQLNPIMKSAGEPAMLLFPFMLSGMVCKLEVQIMPRRPLSDAKEKPKNSALVDGVLIEHIRIKLNLPRLGRVEVNFARAGKQFIGHFNFENDALRRFLETRAGALRSAINRLGYEHIELLFSVSNSAQATNNWFSDFLNAARVIA